MFYHSQPDCLVPLTFPTPSQSGASDLSLIDPSSLVSCPHPAMHGSLTSIILLTDGILTLSAKDMLVIPTYINSIILQSTFHIHCILFHCTLSLKSCTLLLWYCNSTFFILYYLVIVWIIHMLASCYYGTHCPKGVQSDCMGIAKQQLDISACMSS